MGKITSVTTFTGRFGNMIGTTDMKKQAIIRSQAATVANPNTPAQAMARTRFLTATGLAAGLSNGLAGLTPYANNERITLRNAFVKLNASGPNDDNAIIQTTYGADGTEDVASNVSWQNLILSTGEPSTATLGAASFTESQAVTLAASNLTVGDLAYLVIYNPTTNESVSTVTEVTAASQTIRAEVPVSWTGQTVQTYFYTSRLRSGSSLSKYQYISYFNGSDVLAEAIKNAMRQTNSDATFTRSRFTGSGIIG